eukprot:scaffold34280_cov18-Tisochrysis_lutea.AAC.1
MWMWVPAIAHNIDAGKLRLCRAVAAALLRHFEEVLKATLLNCRWFPVLPALPCLATPAV